MQKTKLNISIIEISFKHELTLFWFDTKYVYNVIDVSYNGEARHPDIVDHGHGGHAGVGIGGGSGGIGNVG